MASIKLLLNKGRALKDGSYPLVFQIIHHRQKKLVYTPFKILAHEFDTYKEKLIYVPGEVRSRKEIRNIHRSIAMQRQSIESHIAELERCQSDYSTADILSRYKVEHNPRSLLRYIDQQIELKKKQGKDGTVAALRSTRASMALFVGRKELMINQVTGTFLRDYVLFLRQRKVSDNTICFYTRNLRLMYNQAILDGHQPAGETYPFHNLRAKPRKTIKRAIDREVIRHIAELDLSSKPNLDVARDIFMFSFFARGMSFVDILYLKRPSNIITYSRHKTHQSLNIGITFQLTALIKKYESKSEYLFPILDPTSPKPLYKQYRQALERTNRNLKQVGTLLNLETTLTTYVARHSWATGAKSAGASISLISESLGHTSEKTTQIYLKGLDQLVLDQLNEKVSGL